MDENANYFTTKRLYTRAYLIGTILLLLAELIGIPVMPNSTSTTIPNTTFG